MTTRTSLYYGIRTLVRFVFWTTVAMLTGLGIGTLADALDPDNDNPCRIALGKDFTWQPDGQGFTGVENCDHPANVILNKDGTWRWEN